MNLDRNNRRFFKVGALAHYGLICSLAWCGTSAWAQFDLDSLVEDLKTKFNEPPTSQSEPEQGSESAMGESGRSDDGTYAPIPSQAAGDDGMDQLDGRVEVSSYSTVDIHVQNTDLARVLQMLSIQSQRNIIVSKNVSGTVSADLYDVTFFEALDAILNSNGYGYIEEGPFIKVYTFEEIKTITEAAREMTYRMFQLSYLNAADASVFVTPLLSDGGSIAINGEVEKGFDPDESDGGAESWASYATLVVHDYQDNIDEISGLIDKLDVRPQQVLVEAMVLQTSLNEDNAWGVDWNIIADLNFTDFTNPISAVDNLLAGSGTGGFQPGDNNGTAVGSSVGQTAKSGGLKIGVVSDDISVFLRVLDEVSNTTVVSRPRVLAVNRNRGEILIGRRIGYLSSTSTETSTTQTVQFLDTGTQLIFRPFIGKDGYIRMELKPSISEGIIRDVTGSDGSTFTIPDEITQELTTNVVVRDGFTIVLGGLFKEETTLTRRQIPVLGDIPIIGMAFKGKDDVTRRSEITFLITPTVMKDEVLIARGQEATDMVDRARNGARAGVLKWSNDRQTSMHNMTARELMDAGDNELALWHIDLSLNLNPNQPLVLKMREEILGKPETWFNGSLFDGIGQGQTMSSMNSQPGQPKAAADNSPAPVSDPLLGTVVNHEMNVKSAGQAEPVEISVQISDTDQAPAMDTDWMDSEEFSDFPGGDSEFLDGIEDETVDFESAAPVRVTEPTLEVTSATLTGANEATMPSDVSEAAELDEPSETGESSDVSAAMPGGAEGQSNVSTSSWDQFTQDDSWCENPDWNSDSPNVFAGRVTFTDTPPASPTLSQPPFGASGLGSALWVQQFQADLMASIAIAQCLNPSGMPNMAATMAQVGRFQESTVDGAMIVEVSTDAGPLEK